MSDIDYRKLLIAYIQHIRSEEGPDFLNSLDYEYTDFDDLTPEERAALKAARDEARLA